MGSYMNADSDYITLKAASSIKTTTAFGKAAYLTASMTVGIPSSPADLCVGIVATTNMSEGSDYVNICHKGMAKGTMLSLTVATAGDWLVVDTTGEGALTAAQTNTTAQHIMGQALTASRTGGAVTMLVKVQRYGVVA